MGFQAQVREANQNGTLAITVPVWYVEEHELQDGDVHMFEIIDE